jgi:hypothetical protein
MKPATFFPHLIDTRFGDIKIKTCWNFLVGHVWFVVLKCKVVQ